MADVTLVVDNADGLLPVDFQVLELGRRLYRSGENDYLLNKQRIRLRDLVDLLDAAHLADNAFLFIGQGMVDQALALRPEERRPLFEEVAGVRRHERRRRRAQEQLVESEANLARVEDIVAELRPQARRLAAQAEQQTSRQTTADELAAAILLVRACPLARGGDPRRRDAVAAGGRRVPTRTGRWPRWTPRSRPRPALAAELGARAVAERARREAHDIARATLTAAQLRDARLASEIDADRARPHPARRRPRPPPRPRWPPDAGLAPCPCRPATSTSRRRWPRPSARLADALAELGALRAERQAQGEELAALRRAATARQAELETARRRVDEVARQSAGEGERATAAAAHRDADRDPGGRRARPARRGHRGRASRDRRARGRASGAGVGRGGTVRGRGTRRRRGGGARGRAGSCPLARGEARRGGGPWDRQGGTAARRPSRR